jgi:hypothetical protein
MTNELKRKVLVRLRAAKQLVTRLEALTDAPCYNRQAVREELRRYNETVRAHNFCDRIFGEGDYPLKARAPEQQVVDVEYEAYQRYLKERKPGSPHYTFSGRLRVQTKLADFRKEYGGLPPSLQGIEARDLNLRIQSAAEDPHKQAYVDMTLTAKVTPEMKRAIEAGGPVTCGFRTPPDIDRHAFEMAMDATDRPSQHFVERGDDLQ